ncbi:MAG: helicase-exonuclease AddAB subunit AddA [Syntrophomonadaceae bacterium]|jgi:ATP-dependent helicase/nuclease subunit A|nr:helicase-exonuclease AddAB subunit AddA [Syntrophomonadaceae bacterium]
MTGWTEEQKKAIHSIDQDLLLSAAAGSGKTAVLVQRIIHIMKTRKVNLDQFLIVTFTNAAASEMRERIHGALMAELDGSGAGSENERYFRKQTQILKRSSIGTMHSFCLDVIRTYFHLVDVDPNFRILDANDALLIKRNLIGEMLEESFMEPNALLSGLVEMFGAAKDDTAFDELLLRVYDFIFSQPQPWQWLNSKCAEFSFTYEEFLAGPSWLAWREQMEEYINNMRAYFQQGLKLLQNADSFEGYSDTLQQEDLNCSALLEALGKNGEAFLTALNEMNWPRLRPPGKEADEALKMTVKLYRDEALNIRKKALDPLINADLPAWHNDLNSLYPYMEYLGGLVKEFGELYQSYKYDKACLDFNDLEHLTLAILEHKHVADEYREKFAFIFFDEYQDSNLVQETILEKIKRPDNLFMVGDMKQSIYRFRLADPSLFQSKYQLFKNEKSKGMKIDLNKNFRSLPSLLTGINFVFKNLMSLNLGGVEYTEEVYLNPGLQLLPPADTARGVQGLELNFITNEGSEEFNEKEAQEYTTIEKEALFTAQRIKKIIGQEIYDLKLGAYRPVKYSDVVILLRTTKNWATIFLQTLTQFNIPAYADVNQGYFNALEVDIFINLLRLIDNKRQDIPLLSVMRSDLGAFTPEELWLLRHENQDRSFYDAFLAYIDSHDDDLQKKAAAFLRFLNDWQNDACYMKLDELVIKIMMDSGYYYYVGALAGGEQRQANLRLFLDRVNKFLKFNTPNLHNFLRYYDNLQSSSGDLGAAKLWGENENIVRIMSIHKSKGLEFPIVIVPELGKNFNLQDTSSALLLHRNLGLGPRYTDFELGAYRDTIPRLAIKAAIRRESISEELRVLYVALTRAQNKLILLGSVSDIVRKVQKWQQPIEPSALQYAGNYLDFLGPLLSRHLDGQVLRDCLMFPEMVLADLSEPSSWQVNIVPAQTVTFYQTEKTENAPLKEQTGEKSGQEIIRRLSWQYPFQSATKIPAKLGVTQIANWLQGEQKSPPGIEIPPLNSSPLFLFGAGNNIHKEYNAAERGSLMHFAMQHLDFNNAADETQLARQLQTMVKKELLRPDEAELIPIPKIMAFLESDLGRRVLQAPHLFRETVFNKEQHPGFLGAEFAGSQDHLLVQGVIDLFFEEDGQLVVVDYKTDTIIFKEGGEGSRYQQLLEKYRIQLKIYKEALEEIREQKVKEMYIYFFDLEQAVAVE